MASSIPIEQIRHETTAASAAEEQPPPPNNKLSMQNGHERTAAAWTAKSSNELLWDLRKYLLLLAVLAVTVTYAAGLNPPGGVWLDVETDGDHITGNQVLVVTYHARYNAFSYSNATAFMASAVVIILLLRVQSKDHSTSLTVLRVVMALDMLALAVAYAAGASRGYFTFTTVFASLLVSPAFVFVAVYMVQDSFLSKFIHLRRFSGDKKPTPPTKEDDAKPANGCGCKSEGHSPVTCDKCSTIKRRRKMLMLLAIFAATITYSAGLNPPGGFWPDTQAGHRAGEPVLQGHHWRRYTAFFVCNSAAFVASLLAIALLLTKKLDRSRHEEKEVALYVCVLIALLGLAMAYAVGSCRETESTVYVSCLLGVVLAYIFLQDLVWVNWLNPLVQKIQPCLSTYVERLRRLLPCQRDPQQNCTNGHQVQDPNKAQSEEGNSNPGQMTTPTGTGVPQSSDDHGLKTACSLVLLLATLAASVTYQAGLNPPGGFWPDDREGHKGGDPVLLAKHPARYRVFFYCNSTALAASLVVIFMVQNHYLISKKKTLLKRHALQGVMILDLIGLIGAYAAGSCRNWTTSIFVLALAGAVLVYVVFHMVFFTLDPKDDLNNQNQETLKELEKKRKQLLVLAILVATLTYQAGLTPPGGFWSRDDAELGHHAGDPVLFNNYNRRYMVFFYLNATSFMASIALTILLVNPNLYRLGIHCHALTVCMVASLFGLIGAYAAGSTRHLQTSIYMIALVAAVLTFIIILLLIMILQMIVKLLQKLAGTGDSATPPANEAGGTNNQVVPGGAENNKKGKDTNKNNQVVPGGAENNKIEAPAEKRYLMLLGILAASVTYQAGLAPPGGFWPDNSDGHIVGHPVLRNVNNRRYNIFFYCNSTSFAASIIVMALLLLEEKPEHWKKSKSSEANGTEESEEANGTTKDRPKFIRAMHTAIIIDLIGLLGAYAAGSSREWENCGYVFALVAAVLLYIVIHLSLSFFSQKLTEHNQEKKLRARQKMEDVALKVLKILHYKNRRHKRSPGPNEPDGQCLNEGD